MERASTKYKVYNSHHQTAEDWLQVQSTYLNEMGVFFANAREKNFVLGHSEFSSVTIKFLEPTFFAEKNNTLIISHAGFSVAPVFVGRRRQCAVLPTAHWGRPCAMRSLGSQ